MPAPGTQLRRARRTDFTAVMGLLASAGAPVPPPDRRTLHRFRRLVADLGTDCYLAFADDTLAGLVHVTYARALASPPTARVEQLVVAPHVRHRGVGRLLLSLARTRASRRGCSSLCVVLPPSAPDLHAFFAHQGFGTWGMGLSLPVPGPGAVPADTDP